VSVITIHNSLMSDKCYIVNLIVNLLTSVNCLTAEGRGTPGKPMGPTMLIGTPLRLPPDKRVFVMGMVMIMVLKWQWEWEFGD
jgi:hypothetical protein